MRKYSPTQRVIAHVVLLLGCVIFSFPFFWLLSTSFKESDEILTFPPKWIPRIPSEVVRSPYAAPDEYPPMECPKNITQEQWKRFAEPIRDALTKETEKRLRPDVRGAGIPDLIPRLVDGIWEEAYKGIPDSVWVLPTPQVVRHVVARVDDDLFDKVWNSVYRCFALRDPTVQDVELNEHLLGKRGSLLKNWQRQNGDCQVKIVEQGKRVAAEVWYDFSRAKGFSLKAVFPLPVAPDAFHNITIPLRADKSWHEVYLKIEFGGQAYKGEEGLPLANDIWQEATWQLETPEEKDTKIHHVKDYIPLVDAGKSTFAEPGKMLVTMTVRRMSHASAIVHKFTRNYEEALRFIPFMKYVRNSVFLVIMNVLGQIVSCSLIAYAFARLQWPGRDFFFVVLLGTMMLPPQVTMIPVFLIVKKLGWFNTLYPLWVPAFFGVPFFIFLLRQFMKTIPSDLEDAAKIDGCGYFGIYARIIVPLIKPALAAIGIFTFMGTWNNFMGPLIYVNDQRLYPLSLGLFMFQTTHGAHFGMMMAASMLMTLPVIVIFFLAQKYFIQGVTLTGMKG